MVNRLQDIGPDFSVSVPVSTGTVILVPERSGLTPVVMSLRIEQGTAATLDVNFRNPAGLIANVKNQAVVDMAGYYIKGEKGAGIEAVVTGGSGHVLAVGYYV